MRVEKKLPGSLTELKIVQYPHPTLRYKSKPIIRVDRQLKSIVREMFDLMYQARGIGLAANQVDLPLQVFIVNISGDPNQGEELVFMNPVLSTPKGSHEAEEGCLSIVDVNAMVARPEQIHVSAYDLSGNEINMTVDGMLAKVIQHEKDHLDGVLFIDRISEAAMRQIEGELEDFEIDFESKRSSGEIPDDKTIMQRLAEIESRYCR
jgi:peptide deformylase